ncbi:hypothetical protein EON64_08380, partial [archaeon]
MGLLQFLKHKFSQQHRVSVERVASGTGLVNVSPWSLTPLAFTPSPHP